MRKASIDPCCILHQGIDRHWICSILLYNYNYMLGEAGGRGLGVLGLLISEKGSFDYLSVRVNHSLNSFLPKTVPLESRQYEEIS